MIFNRKLSCITPIFFVMIFIVFFVTIVEAQITTNRIIDKQQNTSIMTDMQIFQSPTVTQTKLVESGSRTLGWSVDIDEDTLVLGAYLENANGTQSGAAYIFSFDTTTNDWIFSKKITGSSVDGRAWFGYAVAIEGNTIVVGAPLDESIDNPANTVGAVFVFEKSDDDWVETDRIEITTTVDGLLGMSVDISGDALIAGDPSDDEINPNAGAAYIYQRNLDNTWSQVTKLMDSTLPNAAEFGESVAIHENTAVVGMSDGTIFGKVYLYAPSENPPNDWELIKEILNGNGFGKSVDIFEDVLVVGSPLYDHESINDGALFSYERNRGGDNNWGQLAVLTSTNTTQLGESVSIHETTIIAGAPFSDRDSNDSGLAVMFKQDSTDPTVWDNIVELIPSDPDANSRFGESVAISNDGILVGRPFSDEFADMSGSAYVFSEIISSTIYLPTILR